MQFNLTTFFQLINTILGIGIIYFIYNWIIKLPKRIKRNEKKVEIIESMLEEINKKLD